MMHTFLGWHAHVSNYLELWLQHNLILQPIKPPTNSLVLHCFKALILLAGLPAAIRTSCGAVFVYDTFDLLDAVLGKEMSHIALQ